MPAPAPARRSLPDAIVRCLRDRILRGELRPGERLPPERELALSLGTNRNTLREALRALEAQGLVRARQGDGVRVLDFRRTGELGLLPHFFRAAGPEEKRLLLVDVLRVRTLVATEAVTLACGRARPEALQRVETLLAGLARAHGEGDPSRLAEAELALYRAVTEAAGSLAGLWMFNTLEELVRGFLDAYPGLWITPESYLDDWARVIRALGGRQAPEARAVLADLLERTDLLVLSALGLAAEEGGTRP